MERRRYSKEEIARRGQEWYEREIHPKVEASSRGKILVIDNETGAYEIDDDHVAANHRARAKHPDAVLYGMRIGYPTLGKLGGGWRTVQP